MNADLSMNADKDRLLHLADGTPDYVSANVMRGCDPTEIDDVWGMVSCRGGSRWAVCVSESGE
jgi:hypothetical protein